MNTPVAVAKIENFRFRLSADKIELVSGFVLKNAEGKIFSDNDGRPHVFKLKRIGEVAGADGIMPGARFV